MQSCSTLCKAPNTSTTIRALTNDYLRNLQTKIIYGHSRGKRTLLRSRRRDNARAASARYRDFAFRERRLLVIMRAPRRPRLAVAYFSAHSRRPELSPGKITAVSAADQNIANNNDHAWPQIMNDSMGGGRSCSAIGKLFLCHRCVAPSSEHSHWSKANPCSHTFRYDAGWSHLETAGR